MTESDVPAFIETVSKAYAPYKGLDATALEQVIFATKPASGAGGTFRFISFLFRWFRLVGFVLRLGLTALNSV